MTDSVYAMYDSPNYIFPYSFLASVAAIVIGFLAIVLIVLVGAYYFKIR